MIKPALTEHIFYDRTKYLRNLYNGVQNESKNNLYNN